MTYCNYTILFPAGSNNALTSTICFGQWHLLYQLTHALPINWTYLNTSPHLKLCKYSSQVSISMNRSSLIIAASQLSVHKDPKQNLSVDLAVVAEVAPPVLLQPLQLKGVSAAVHCGVTVPMLQRLQENAASSLPRTQCLQRYGWLSPIMQLPHLYLLLFVFLPLWLEHRSLARVRIVIITLRVHLIYYVTR